jgi:putative N6-adenine-specific DNA methylase
VKAHDLFAVTAHGLAALCAAELAAIGVAGRVETGGVAWRGTASSMYRANLELRTASRIIARVGTFRARGFAELERRAARLPWQNFLRQATPVVLRVTCRKSKLYHEGAVGERVARVLADTAGVSVVRGGSGDDEADDAYDVPGAPNPPDAPAAGAPSTVQQGAQSPAGAQLIIIRFMRDECTISVDSSGALLHQRGYRRAVAKAPLRETMAAALLLAAGWRGDMPLLDPLCGSGTIPIEAALLAGGIAPGIARADRTPRAFAFEAWPHFDGAAYSEIVRSARAAVRPVRAPIVGADRNAGAIAAARANADRAGVLSDLEFRRASLADLEAMPGSGHVVTNPPYGVRVGDRRELRALYATLGRTISARLPGWSVTMLAADDALAAATGLPLVEQLATRNGGIPVRLLSTAGTGAARPVYQPPHSDEEYS